MATSRRSATRQLDAGTQLLRRRRGLADPNNGFTPDYTSAGGLILKMLPAEPSTWAMMSRRRASVFAGYRKGRKARRHRRLSRSHPQKEKPPPGRPFSCVRRRPLRAARAPNRSATPNASTARRGDAKPFATSGARREFSPAASRIAVALAKTAIQARRAVPLPCRSPWRRRRRLRAANNPCAIASHQHQDRPEQGRAPRGDHRSSRGPPERHRVSRTDMPTASGIVRQFAGAWRPGTIAGRRKVLKAGPSPMPTPA